MSTHVKSSIIFFIILKGLVHRSSVPLLLGNNEAHFPVAQHTLDGHDI